MSQVQHLKAHPGIQIHPIYAPAQNTTTLLEELHLYAQLPHQFHVCACLEAELPMTCSSILFPIYKPTSILLFAAIKLIWNAPTAILLSITAALSINVDSLAIVTHSCPLPLCAWLPIYNEGKAGTSDDGASPLTGITSVSRKGTP